jgi:hypothetical protein
MSFLHMCNLEVDSLDDERAVVDVATAEVKHAYLDSPLYMVFHTSSFTFKIEQTLAPSQAKRLSSSAIAVNG